MAWDSAASICWHVQAQSWRSGGGTLPRADNRYREGRNPSSDGTSLSSNATMLRTDKRYRNVSTSQFESRNFYDVRPIDCPQEWEEVDLD